MRGVETKVVMTPERYRQADTSGELTKDEIAKGWHFCRDWDQMLVGPGMLEVEGCCCDPMGNSYAGS